MSQEANNIGATSLSVRLFTTFFRIGAFTLGGGYAMIPIIEEDIVNKRHWITREDFLDLIAVAQSCPGVFAINICLLYTSPSPRD